MKPADLIALVTGLTLADDVREALLQSLLEPDSAGRRANIRATQGEMNVFMGGVLGRAAGGLQVIPGAIWEVLVEDAHASS